MKTSEQINELAAALCKAQAMMKPAKKSELNPYFKSKYADLTNVIENDRKALSSNGLSVIQGASFAGKPDGEPLAVMLTTRLVHTSGQWVEEFAGAVPKDYGPQSVGACITYLRRYGYQAMVGATAEGDDDDGESVTDHKGGVELVDPRTALVKRLADLGDLISESDKVIIRTTLKTLPTAELAPFVERWEAKAAKSAGAGVPDEQVAF
jgi:hypothetical protein